nr:MAG TPA: protein of unknown function (DUF4636) [Caudoviricetes sp.]
MIHDICGDFCGIISEFVLLSLSSIIVICRSF